MEDGMSEEEALLAVQPPILKNNIDIMNESNSNNLLKLKNCFVRIQRLPYIELAVKKGCSTLLMTPNNNNNSNWVISEPQVMVY